MSEARQDPFAPFVEDLRFFYEHVRRAAQVCVCVRAAVAEMESIIAPPKTVNHCNHRFYFLTKQTKQDTGSCRDIVTLVSLKKLVVNFSQRPLFLAPICRPFSSAPPLALARSAPLTPAGARRASAGQGGRDHREGVAVLRRVRVWRRARRDRGGAAAAARARRRAGQSGAHCCCVCVWGG